MSTSLQYRPEIDGLRTIAVCSVIIYHAKFSGLYGMEILPGGFLGVDIFFVISGFLITSIIIKEIKFSGKFSIKNFYERRARRILPVIFLVIVCSLPFAWRLLMPMQMVEFSKSIVSSLLFFSNFFWYSAETVYGAESGLIKPFLHTWSLSVEEQFYIFYPLVLIFLWKNHPTIIIPLFVSLIIGGMVFSEILTANNKQLSFFSPFSRLWELMAGGLLAYVVHNTSLLERPSSSCNFLPFLGLFMILASLLIPGIFPLHPGFVTLPVVFGTVLIIAFSKTTELVTRILSSFLFTYIGLISYSLYLWHYPIFAFGRIINPDPSFFEKILWIFISFVLSVASYNLVEKPMRHANIVSASKALFVGASSASAILFFCFIMLAVDGLPSRLYWLEKIYGSRDYDTGTLKNESWSKINMIPLSYGYSDFPGFHARKATDFESDVLWFDTKINGETILIVGNSLSNDLFSALHQNKELFYPRQFARFALRDDFPRSQVEQLVTSPNFLEADTIIVAHAYTEWSIANFSSFLERVKPFGKKIVLASEPPLFEKIEGYWPYDWYIRDLTKGSKIFDVTELSEITYASLDLKKIHYIDQSLKEISRKHGVFYLNRLHLLCSLEKRECDSITPDGRRIFTDQHHYSLAGAAYMGRIIFLTNWLEIN